MVDSIPLLFSSREQSSFRSKPKTEPKCLTADQRVRLSESRMNDTVVSQRRRENVEQVDVMVNVDLATRYFRAPLPQLCAV